MKHTPLKLLILSLLLLSSSSTHAMEESAPNKNQETGLKKTTNNVHNYLDNDRENNVECQKMSMRFLLSNLNLFYNNISAKSQRKVNMDEVQAKLRTEIDSLSNLEEVKKLRKKIYEVFEAMSRIYLYPRYSTSNNRRLSKMIFILITYALTCLEGTYASIYIPHVFENELSYGKNMEECRKFLFDKMRTIRNQRELDHLAGTLFEIVHIKNKTEIWTPKGVVEMKLVELIRVYSFHKEAHLNNVQAQ